MHKYRETMQVSVMKYMDIIKIGLMVLMVVTLHNPVGESCSCQPTHPQTAFCHADFVVKARVKGNQTIFTKSIEEIDGQKIKQRFPYQKMYHIRISKTFKENAEFQNSTQKHHLYTGLSQSQCGMELKRNTKYLLGGYMSGGKAYISLCNTAIEWTSVPVRVRKGLNYLYELNCGCQIKLCWSPLCEQQSYANDTCLYNIGTDTGNCYMQHSMCAKKESGRCHWTKPKMLTHCLKEEEKYLEQLTNKFEP